MFGHPAGEVFEDVVNGDARAANAGLAASHAGGEGDAVLEIHARILSIIARAAKAGGEAVAEESGFLGRSALRADAIEGAGSRARRRLGEPTYPDVGSESRPTQTSVHRTDPPMPRRRARIIMRMQARKPALRIRTP